MIKNKLKVLLEGVAVPEVRVDHEDEDPKDELEKEVAEERNSVTYETLAIPEIHIKHS